MLPAMAFVGREPELAQLAEAVRRVAEGERGRVALTGAAGIGCSSLIEELTRRVLTVPGVVACLGRAYEPSVGIPYQALGDALADVFKGLSDVRLAHVVDTMGHDLSGVVPGLATRLDDAGIDHVDPLLRAPDKLGRRVIESLLGALDRLADGGVLLLVIEDIHFADAATRGFIDAVMTVGSSLPICLLVSYQPDEIHRRHPARALTDRLSHDNEVTRLEVGPLPDRELARLVEQFVGGRPSATVMKAVLEGAHGNPLVASQLVLSAEQLAGVHLSDPFAELTGARLATLGTDANNIIRVLAAARQPLDRATLRDASQQLGRRPTLRGLEEAIESGLVSEVGERVGMSHELHTEAVEVSQLTPERQAHHGAIAAVLDESAPALAAWHWAQAARPLHARAAHLRAAESARLVDPSLTTLYHFDQALELVADGDSDIEQRAETLAGAARASAADGSFRRAAALMRQAIDKRATRSADRGRGARDDASRMALGQLVAEQGRFEWASGEVEMAVRTMRRALEIMPDTVSRLRAGALASLAHHLMIDGEFDESARLAEDARATARAAIAAGEPALGVFGHATCTLGVDVAYLGDLRRGLALLEEAESASREAECLDDLMRTAGNRTTLLDLEWRREEAVAVGQTSLADAAAGGLSVTYGAFLRGNAADILYQLGRWEEAEYECRTVLEWQSRRLDPSSFQALVTLGLLLTESRADEEASSVVGQALLQLGTVPAGQWTGNVLRASVSLALWNAESDQALSIAEKGWPDALKNGDVGIVASAASTCLEAAAAAADDGRRSDDAGLIARARDLAAAILPEAEARVAASPMGPIRGAGREAELALATARAHWQRVRGAPDADAWAEVAVGWADASMPFPRAKARWWQALALLEAATDEEGRERARSSAAEPLSEAYKLVRELGALPLMREIVDLAARARVRLPLAMGDYVSPPSEIVAVGPGVPRGASAMSVGPGRGSVEAKTTQGSSSAIARAIEERVLAALNQNAPDEYGLSPREHEVLIIVAEGRTDRDIAARLFISERTVHVHVRRILSKLGVSSRTEAAGMALREGLVPMHSASSTASPDRTDDVASAP